MTLLVVEVKDIVDAEKLRRALDTLRGTCALACDGVCKAGQCE